MAKNMWRRLSLFFYFPRLKKKTAIIFGPTEKQKYKETMAENNWNSRGKEKINSHNLEEEI